MNKVNLYLESGFADMKNIMSIPTPWVLVLGGRGTGKTYGALKEVLENKYKFIYMRRTQTECDMINKPEFSPFRPFRELGYFVKSESISKYNAAFYLTDSAGNKSEEAIGYTCALSTISNMRGFDASDVTILIYDEFIPENHARPLRSEGAALFNCYETINRNRELLGKQPLKLVALSNTNRLDCPIFSDLRLIDSVDRMARKHHSIYQDSERGISVIMLQDSPISMAKKSTALYRLTNNTEFSRMAVNNEFSNEDYSYIKSCPINEYRPIVLFDDICIYEHKSKSEYYVTRHVIGDPVRYNNTELDRKHFKSAYGGIYLNLIAGNVLFSDYYCKAKLTSIF